MAKLTVRMIYTAATCLCFILLVNSEIEKKWSRQVEITDTDRADNFDWVPLAPNLDSSTAANDRSPNGRALGYSQAFPPNGRFADLSKAHSVHFPPSQQPSGFDFPYQFQSFAPNLRQPLQSQQHHQPLKAAALQSQPPTSQSFFKFEMPLRGERHRPANAPNNLQTNYQIQHAFGGGAQATLFQSPVFNDNAVFPPDFHAVIPKPQAQPLQQKLPPQQNFVQDSYSPKNSFRESKPVPSFQETLQTVTPQVFPSNPQPEPLYELNKPSSFQVHAPFHQIASSAAPPLIPVSSAQTPINGALGQTPHQQEVQLLYVPYDTLYNTQQHQRPNDFVPAQNNPFAVNKYNLNPSLPAVNPYLINQFYTPEPLPQQEFKYFTTSTTNRPQITTTPANNPLFQSFNQQQYTTQKPKAKAHQPPLAMFFMRSTARPTRSDVVSFLRNAKTIDVIDAPTKHIPEIFVGPAGMPIPNGYVKFDLPYLSQLSQMSQHLNDVSFFVAPLSYRTPNGFNKILLPEPHVGSIVINRAKSNTEVSQAQKSKTSVSITTPNQNGGILYQNSEPQHEPSNPIHTRPLSPSQTDYYPEEYLRNPNKKNHKNNNKPPENTTPQTMVPSRGNKFSYYYDRDVIQEVSSPKITKHDRQKKKRPQQSVQSLQQPVFRETQNHPYAQFQPIPNQITNDDFYRIQPTRTPTTTSTTTAFTTTTRGTTPASTTSPSQYFDLRANPQFDYHEKNNNAQFFHGFSSAPEIQSPLEYVPQFTTILSSTTPSPKLTTAEEEYRMKQYYRTQNAFRSRPQVTSTSSPFEYVNYTPISLDFDQVATTPPATTTPAYKQRITFYTPTSYPTPIPKEEPNTLPPPTERNRIEAFNTLPPHTEHVPEKAVHNTFPPQTEQYHEEPTLTEKPVESKLPSNHRPLYNQNEIHDGAVEYEPNPYQLPSELPPLTPNLPGLVNGLIEKDRQREHGAASPEKPLNSEEHTSRAPAPSRRPHHRVRKPVATKISSSVSYSESESTSRRPSHRTRRPFGSRSSSTTPASLDYVNNEYNEPTPKPTRRPATSRKPFIRNPNRIRYQPTPEERESLRLKSRKKYNSRGKLQESEDIDYQRDVLKQNYPVFRPSEGTRKATSPTAFPDTYSDVAAPTYNTVISESQQVYTVTPINSIPNNDSTGNKKEQTFPAGLLEPMQIAQQYKEYSEENYGPGYFPNQEDISPTEPVVRNEINAIYTTVLPTPTTTTTTTTPPPATTTEEQTTVTTRRSPFKRRNYPRLRLATTEAPTTILPITEETQTIRPRIPPRKLVRVRSRTRRPHPASTTKAPDQDEDAEQENYRDGETEFKINYRKLNRFNQDFYEDDVPRRRAIPQFHLDGEESQWSPAIHQTIGKNNFKPLNAKDKEKKIMHSFENEPEIVTAGAEYDQANVNKADVYEVKVSANLGSSGTLPKTKILKPNLKPEKSFAELLEEVMGKAPDEQTASPEPEMTTKTTDGTLFESQKNVIIDRLKRRGKWKKLRPYSPRTAQRESFETSESQNLGTQLLNSLHANETKTGDVAFKTTATPKTSTTSKPQESTTTIFAANIATTSFPPTSPTTLTAYDEITNVMPESTPQIPSMVSLLDDDVEEKSLGTTFLPEITEENSAQRAQDTEDDLETQPSLFSEVKRQLHELFSIEESDDQAVNSALAAVGKRHHKYTNIKRARPESTTEAVTARTTQTIDDTTLPTEMEELASSKKPFHKELMEHVVYATATSTKVSSETEICYRGRCIRSEDLPPNHKLQ